MCPRALQLSQDFVTDANLCNTAQGHDKGKPEHSRSANRSTPAFHLLAYQRQSCYSAALFPFSVQIHFKYNSKHHELTLRLLN
jgi:hypothetical protein